MEKLPVTGSTVSAESTSKRSLVLNGAFDGDPAVRGANHTWNHRQRGFELLLNQGEGSDLLVAKGLGRSRRLLRGLGGLGSDLHLLADDHLVRKLDLEGGGCPALGNLDIRLGDRFVTDCGTGHPVSSWNQPGKLESPSVTSSYRTSLLRKSSAPQGADGARNGCARSGLQLLLGVSACQGRPFGQRIRSPGSAAGPSGYAAWMLSCETLITLDAQKSVALTAIYTLICRDKATSTCAAVSFENSNYSLEVPS